MGTMEKMHQNISPESYAKNMGFVDESIMMANSYTVVRFEVFTAVTMKNAVFWGVAPCRCSYIVSWRT
jgi:hypothetical protein